MRVAKKERLPLAALLRRVQEEEEARREADQRRADAAMIERCVRRYGCYWPGMWVAPDSRGPLARAAGALLERLFGGR
ncbi:MAG: hypothetical protein HY553_08385 [Elusimicrobia bacterium]|nr:hypothetical protein [Elusimicrobiota bacterium]